MLLYEMRLAIEAMSVPSPPMLHPTTSAGHSAEKPESRSAAGTLLITWLASTDTITSLPSITEDRKARKACMLPILPIKMKSATNVPSRE